MSLWNVIAKNVIRLKTSRFRKNRRLFFIIIYSIFLFWAFYLGPLLIDAILPEVVKYFSETYEQVLALIIEYFLVTFFLIYLYYPLFILFRKEEIAYKEILLASPVNSGDVFIGEFLGQLPFFFLFILGIGPLGTSIILQVNPNLTFFAYLVFYISITLLLVLALLIGSIIANWLENKMLKSKRLDNLRNLLAVLLSMFMMLTFYLIHFIFELISNNQELKNYIMFYPSLWYSNIILYIINPSLIESYILNIWVSISLAYVVPLLVFYISYKKANIFYNLDFKIESEVKHVKKENIIYHLARKISPKKWEHLIIAQLKEFLRKKENVLKLIFSSIFIGFLGVFIITSLKGPSLNIGNNPLGIELILEILYHEYLQIVIIAWIGSLILGIFTGISIILNSKDILFLYKKSPRGINAFIWSYIFNIIFLVFFMNILLTIFFVFLFQFDPLLTLLFFIIFLFFSTILILQAFAIQCIKPLFEERGKDVLFQIYILIFMQVLSFFITFLIYIPTTYVFIDISLGILHIFLINFGVSVGFTVLLLFLGIRKLNKIE